MKSFLGLMGVAAVVGSFGCGTTINVMGDDGDGSGGAGGSTVVVGPGPGPSTSTGVIPNPPECPAYAPNMYDSCDFLAVDCTYTEERGCTVSYTCVPFEDCPGGDVGVSGTGGYYDGGYGGYGDCYQYAQWYAESASCQPAAVDCYNAVAGDTCAMPGDYCSGGYDECGGLEKWCGEDHTWEVNEWYDECCYDDCCYDECCYDEGYYCPEVVPQYGEYCDPCYNSDYCSYEVEDPYCGAVYADAYCNAATYTWEVYTEGCVGTGGSGGGWEGTGGGWEGEGGGWNVATAAVGQGGWLPD